MSETRIEHGGFVVVSIVDQNFFRHLYRTHPSGIAYAYTGELKLALKYNTQIEAVTACAILNHGLKLPGKEHDRLKVMRVVERVGYDLEELP